MVNKKLSKTDEDSIERMKNENLSNRQVAYKIGVSETTVRNYLKKINWQQEKLTGGRPVILSKREERKVCNKFITADLQNTTNGVKFVKEEFQKKFQTELFQEFLKIMVLNLIKNKKNPWLVREILTKGGGFMKNIRIIPLKNFQSIFLQMKVLLG